MFSTRVRVASLVALVSVFASVPFAFAAAPVSAETPSSPDVVMAIDWLLTQQQSDGGFEANVPPFQGFETPDAILTIAEGGADLVRRGARARRWRP